MAELINSDKTDKIEHVAAPTKSPIIQRPAKEVLKSSFSKKQGSGISLIPGVKVCPAWQRVKHLGLEN